jgi:hypothetical protein
LLKYLFVATISLRFVWLLGTIHLMDDRLELYNLFKIVKAFFNNAIIVSLRAALPWLLAAGGTLGGYVVGTWKDYNSLVDRVVAVEQAQEVIPAISKKMDILILNQEKQTLEVETLKATTNTILKFVKRGN